MYYRFPLSLLSLFIDVDECVQNSTLCNINANCTNTDGSYMCQCQDGYEGDGINCTGILMSLHQGSGIKAFLQWL